MDKHMINEMNVLSDSNEQFSSIELSVICPFYNEEQILEQTVMKLLDQIEKLSITWELIVVNDGSTDGSIEIIKSLLKKSINLRYIGYPFNKGRGYALRQGIAKARGNIIITTEIDLSWGEDIIERLYNKMKELPQLDILVASPHLPGGKYKNVPFERVFLSWLGNFIIRAFVSNAVTMNTGMTRAYRREIIQNMPLEEDRKEFHLEVILKAKAFKYHIGEIPCVLEWKDYKHKGKRVKRKSSSEVKRLVLTHTLFSLFANPIRYVWGIGGFSMFISFGFFIWSIIRLLGGLVSVFTIIISLSFGIISMLFFAFGIIAQQGYMMQKEIWTLKQDFQQLNSRLINKFSSKREK